VELEHIYSRYAYNCSSVLHFPLFVFVIFGEDWS